MRKANVWIDHLSPTQDGILRYKLYDLEDSHICVKKIGVFFQNIFAADPFPKILSGDGKINLYYLIQ